MEYCRESLQTTFITFLFSICFHTHTVHLDIIKVFFSPTDAQVNCLKNNFKIYIKTDITTAPTTSEQGNVHTPTRTH